MCFVSVCVRRWWSGTGGCVWSSVWCLSSWSTASNTSCPTSLSAGGIMWVKQSKYTLWIMHCLVLKRPDKTNSQEVTLSCCSGSWMCCCVTGWVYTVAWRLSVGSPWSHISGRDCGTSQHTSKNTITLWKDVSAGQTHWTVLTFCNFVFQGEN